MPKDTRGVDHVIVLGRDLDRSEERYRKLGFQIAPRMFHPFGTANNLIMFEKDFIELLGVVDESKLTARTAQITDTLDKREGLFAIAFLSTDAVQDKKEFEATGLKPSDVFEFRRLVPLPDGREITAEVSVVNVFTPWPASRFFVSQQHVAEAIWVKEWQVHPNGATAVETVVLVHDKPADAAEYFDQILGGGASKAQSADEVHVRTVHGFIDVLSPALFLERYGERSETDRPYLSAMDIRVRSLAVVKDILRAEAVGFTENDGVIVGSKDGCGAVLRFVETSRAE